VIIHLLSASAAPAALHETVAAKMHHEIAVKLAGRLVAWSFALIATAYYLNIFATLSTRELLRQRKPFADLDRARAKLIVTAFLAETTMRACAIGLAIPCLVAIYAQPAWWPLCAGIGTGLVAANNFATWKLTSLSERNQGPRVAAKAFAEDTRQYSRWWWLMASYSAGLLVVGYAFHRHVVHDALAFAFVVVGTNTLKLFLLNSTSDAPRVRAALERGVFLVEHEFQPRSGEAPLADVYECDWCHRPTSKTGRCLGCGRLAIARRHRLRAAFSAK
jgi:hypothetical protein